MSEQQGQAPVEDIDEETYRPNLTRIDVGDEADDEEPEFEEVEV